MMGILGRSKKPPPPDDSPLELPVFCYRTAYFVLPQLLFGDPERVWNYFTDNEYPVGPYLYVMAAQMLKVEPVREHITSFQAHTGELSPQKEFAILQYPTPPAVDLTLDAPLLAPFFSTLIRENTTKQISYYILGQNPLQGTTFRSVTPDGANSNMGPGPQPELESWIEFLRQRA